MHLSRRDLLAGAGSIGMVWPLGACAQSAPRGKVYAHGMNLAASIYYSKEYPFIDLWKQRSPNRSALVDASGEATGSDGAAVTQWGIPMLDGKHTYDVITDGAVRKIGFAGGVVGLKYNGQAMNVSLTGKQTTQFTLDHEGPTSFKLSTASPTKVAIVETQHRALHDAGEIFRPDFVDGLRGFEILRFMDWNGTNGRFATTEPRAHIGDPVWAPRVPIEVQAMLCNKIGADMWLNLPAAADDAYVVESVTAAHKTLLPGLRIYLEYSNEIWNGGFKQTPWMVARATEANIPKAQMYGLLSGAMAKAAATVAGPQRIRTMLCWQGSATTAWPTIMTGWDASGAPRALIESFCIATYPDLAKADAAQWTAWAKTEDYAAALAYMLGRQKERAAYFPKVAAQAKAYGVTFSRYEHNAAGGLKTNAPSPIAGEDRPAVLAFDQAFAHSPAALAIFKADRADFLAAGGAHDCAFNDFGAGSQYGQWGTLGPSSLGPAYPAAALIRAENAAAWAPHNKRGWLGQPR